MQLAVKRRVVRLHVVNEELVAHAQRGDALQHRIIVGRRGDQCGAAVFGFQVARKSFRGQTPAEADCGDALQFRQFFGVAFFQPLDDVFGGFFKHRVVSVPVLVARVAVEGFLGAVRKFFAEPFPAGDVGGGDFNAHILAVGFQDFSIDIEFAGGLRARRDAHRAERAGFVQRGFHL